MSELVSGAAYDLLVQRLNEVTTERDRARAIAVALEQEGATLRKRVEIAFDSGFATPMADRTYTDVSAFVEALLDVTEATS